MKSKWATLLIMLVVIGMILSSCTKAPEVIEKEVTKVVEVPKEVTVRAPGSTQESSSKSHRPMQPFAAWKWARSTSTPSRLPILL